MRRALVLNAGSSSLKYGLFDVSSCLSKAALLCSGLADRIGAAASSLTHSLPGKPKQTHDVPLPDYGAALAAVMREVGDVEVGVIGHRVVHGGEHFSAPALIDQGVEAAIEQCAPLAPLHNPANLQCIRFARQAFSAPHVAVFDTAFHATMPPDAFRYALPTSLYTNHAIRKYGFHGSSYAFVVPAAAAALGRPAADLNMIVMHLGNGASITCVEGGRSVDTSMGMTPLEGLVMGTRCGDVDAAVFSHLCSLGHTPAEVDTILNKKSGLLGLCGRSDMRSVREAAAAGDADAALARRLFVERVRKYVGAFLVRLRGRVDALVFTAGIGEHDAELRALVCEGLQPFGIAIDEAKNADCSELRQLQPDGHGPTAVLVVPTNEELSIALQSARLVPAL